MHVYRYITAVKWLIIINCIQNKSFVYIVCMYTVYIYYVYIITNTYRIYFEHFYMYTHLYIYSLIFVAQINVKKIIIKNSFEWLMSKSREQNYKVKAVLPVLISVCILLYDSAAEELQSCFDSQHASVVCYWPSSAHPAIWQASAMPAITDDATLTSRRPQEK